MGAGEWIALAGGVVTLLTIAVAATWRLSRTASPPTAAAEVPPLAQIQHDVRNLRAEVRAMAEDLAQVTGQLREADRWRWPAVTQALDRQSEAITSAAASLRQLHDLASRLAASAARRED